MYLILANKRSGNGRFERLAKKLEGDLKRLKLPHRTVAVEALSDIKEALKANLSPQTEGLVIAGGDSTVNEVINAISRRRLPLAIIPIGQSNALARSLGIRSVREALSSLKKFEFRDFQLGAIEERFFIGNLTVAPRKNLLKALNRKRTPLHHFFNILGLAPEEEGLEASPIEVTLDDKLTFKGNLVSLVVQLNGFKEGFFLQVITKDQADKLTENRFRANRLKLKSETNLLVASGDDTTAARALTVRVIPRRLPLMVGPHLTNPDLDQHPLKA